MTRRLIPAVVVLALAECAFAQDAKVLGRDDIEFAKSLVANGFPDLAERLLGVLEKQGGSLSAEAAPQIRAIKLDVAQDAAAKIDDLIKRKDALIKVLKEKLKFVEEFKGSQAAEDCRNLLPELYNLVGETLTSAIKKETDPKILDALRAEGDGIFVAAEQAMKNRIADLRKQDTRTEEEEFRLQATRYNFARTLYYHSLIFAPGTGRRGDLCNEALNEYGEFELDYDESSLLYFYAYVDTANCLKEIGKPDEAIATLEKVISLRESYGEKDAKSGCWPIAPRDVGDLVCYAMLQKMLLLKEQKKPAEVIAVAKDYLGSTKEPFDAPSSMLVARELGDAQVATGDVKGAIDTANKMIKADEVGIGAVWGRQLKEQMGGGGVPYTDKLKSASAKLQANDYERALAICNQVIVETAGTPDETNANCSALLLIGFAYQKRGWFEESALAYQTAVDRYPTADGASEALVLAIDMYQAANRVARRAFYKGLIDEAKNRLVTQYPKDPRAQEIQLVTAKDLEGDQDWLGAIKIYEGVAPTSTVFTKAKLLMGIDYYNLAIKLTKDGKPDEAKQYYPLAEKSFKAAIQAIAERRGSTLDTKILEAYDTQEYLSSLSLAKLYMVDAFGRIADAEPMIGKLEAKWGSDSDKGNEIQNLRGKLYLDQGKYEEAEKWVDDLFKRNKVAAAGPAGLLARAYDHKGDDERKAKPGSIAADDLWKRAARFYYISIKPQVDGVASQRPGEMTDVGNRLFAYGLHFNGYPAERTGTTFVGWTPGPRQVLDHWIKAAEIYEAALNQTPDYRMTINLGRAYGFLGKWADAARVYSKLFEQEQILTKDKRKLDPTVTKAKGELVFAYLEWGVTERMAFAADNDKDRIVRCLNVIFAPLCNTLRADTSPEAYWGARYHFVRALMDKGLYNDAKLSIEDVQRQVSATFDDGKFGYKALFEATIDELKKK